MNWKRCADELPPADILVMTKIDDSDGCRNEGMLKRYQREENTRSLWFVRDGSMYVYYSPTHWRELTQIEKLKEKNRIEAEAIAAMERSMKSLGLEG